MGKPWIYTQPFASVYPAYVAKAERKGRTKQEVDEIISWLTGYDADSWQSTWQTKLILRHSLRRRQVLILPAHSSQASSAA